MKNGLIEENGKLVYYENDKPVHAGVIKIDGAIYYIGTNGIAATGRHAVHTSMANGILKRGTYSFGKDGKLIKGSYVSPKRSNKKSKKRKNNTKKQLWILGALLVVLLVVVAISLVLDAMDPHSGAPVETTADTTAAEQVKVKLPEFSEEVVLTSQGALDAYYGKVSIWEARTDGDPYKPFLFTYNLYGEDGVLLLSENETMTDARQMTLDGDKSSLEINNLKTGTQYYYKVTVKGQDFTGSFKTAAATRFVSIDGLYNARDIGGYTTLDGKTIKQGMIIRGAELDGLVEPSYCLNKAALSEMQNTFGFVYDMDLRADDIFTGEYVSYLGKDVAHAFYAAPQYGEIFDEAFKESLYRIFSDLSKEENYPMYMHCTYGKDRTGTIVFLLQALLNMSEEDLIREFQRTGFFVPSFANSNACNVITAGLASKEGDTLQEKTIRFLIDDIGITQEQIEAIQTILLQ